MSRFRWYRAKWPTRIRDLGQRLQNAPFHEGKSEGFALDRVRDDVVEGRFIERIEVQDRTVDPFGEQLQFDRVEYRQQRFRLSNVRPGLELIGSSIGSMVLVSRLAEASDFQLSVSNCSVDVMKWLLVFRERSQFPGFVDIMQIGKIDLGSGISARAIIRGKEDVKAAGAMLTHDRGFSIEKVQYRLGGEEKGSVTFSNSGSVIIRVADSARIVEFVRGALEDLEQARPEQASV